MIKLLAMDGLNLIRRIFAVQQRQYTDDVIDDNLLHNVTQEVKGTVERLLKQFQPSHAVIVFDGEGDNWRRQLFPEYKANRQPAPKELLLHLDSIQQQLYELGIDSLLTASDEADDLIASLVKKIPADRGECIIVSTDKDYLQLLNQSNVQIWHHFNRQWLDRDYVQQKFHLSPEQLVDYFALVGDSGHNVKGVDKIGAKTAEKLLQQRDLATWLENEEFVAKYNINRNQVLLYKLLFCLKQDIELNFHLRDIRYLPR